MDAMPASLKRLRNYHMLATLVVLMLIGSLACAAWIKQERFDLFQARSKIIHLQTETLLQFRLLLSDSLAAVFPKAQVSSNALWISRQETLLKGDPDGAVTDPARGEARKALIELQPLASRIMKDLRNPVISRAGFADDFQNYHKGMAHLQELWAGAHHRMQSWLTWAGIFLFVMAVGLIVVESIFITKPMLNFLYHHIKRNEIIGLAKISHKTVIQQLNQPRGETSGYSYSSRQQASVEPQLAETIPASIMIVEDHPANQKYIRKLFQRLGYEVEIAGNGKEAVAKALVHAFDLIFMDIQMPLMDGLEATYQILQKTDPNHHPVIIALTGSTEPETREKCLHAGMKDIIWKPVKLDQITKSIMNWVQGKEVEV